MSPEAWQGWWGGHGTAAPGSAALFLQETRGLLSRVEALAGQGALPAGRGCGWQVAFSVTADAAIGTARLFLCSISAPVLASLERGPAARAIRHPEDGAWPRVLGAAEERGAGSVGVSGAPEYVFHSLSWLMALTLGPSPSRERKGRVFLCCLEISAQPSAGLSSQRRFPRGCFSVGRAESCW